MNTEFEKVYTVTHYWDHPRGGIADFHGVPHVYQSEFDEEADDWSSTLLLFPIDDETLQLALEDWGRWKRWRAAFHRGEVAPDSHPALPEDEGRYDELKPLLKSRLQVDPRTAIKAQGQFKIASEGGSGSLKDWLVKWSEVQG